MSREGGPEPVEPRAAGHLHRTQLDSAHLDEDAECLEDPVHCGDARHQQEAHTHPHPVGAEPPQQA